jgi:hypothetical protein
MLANCWTNGVNGVTGGCLELESITTCLGGDWKVDDGGLRLAVALNDEEDDLLVEDESSEGGGGTGGSCDVFPADVCRFSN